MEQWKYSKTFSAPPLQITTSFVIRPYMLYVHSYQYPVHLPLWTWILAKMYNPTSIKMILSFLFLGLKTVISELPPSSTALASSICKKITGRLTSAISKVIFINNYIIDHDIRHWIASCHYFKWSKLSWLYYKLTNQRDFNKIHQKRQAYAFWNTPDIYRMYSCWPLMRPLKDIVCQWLTACCWFSPGTLVSSTYKADHHDKTEILLKVALNTMTLTQIIVCV